MTDSLPVMIIFLALGLGLVSVLLYVSLGSRGVARSRIIRIIIEVWLSFALVVGAFALINLLLGPTARTGVANELLGRIARIRELAPRQQMLIVGMFAIALAIFIHLIWALQRAQSKSLVSHTFPEEESNNDAA